MDDQIQNNPKSNKGLRVALITSLTLLVLSVTYIFLSSNPDFSNPFLSQQKEDSNSFNGLTWGDKEEGITTDGIKYTVQDIYTEQDTTLPILEAVTIEDYTYYVDSFFSWAGIDKKVELSNGDTYYIAHGGSSNCQSAYLFNQSGRTRILNADAADMDLEDSKNIPLFTFWNDYLIYQDCNTYGISAFNVKNEDIIKIAIPTKQMTEDSLGYFLKNISDDTITIHECPVWSSDCSGEKILNLDDYLNQEE
jgi:hypothetical protein